MTKAGDEVQKNLINFSFRALAWLCAGLLTISVAFAKMYVDYGDEKVLYKVNRLNEKMDAVLINFKIPIPKEKDHE